jgi:hypothetical protein
MSYMFLRGEEEEEKEERTAGSPRCLSDVCVCGSVEQFVNRALLPWAASTHQYE